MPTQQGMNGLYSRCGRDDTPCVFVPPESEKTRTPKGMGEISEGQKSQYLVQAILEKEDRKWLEEVIQKTIKESVRELGICGTTEQLKTKPSSEEIPDQMMDFLSQMENL